MQELRTQQQNIVNALVEQFGVDARKIIFFPEDLSYPWMPGKQLAKVAQRSGLFKTVRVDHEKVIEVGPDRQLHSQATLVDLRDCIYSLPGVASVGEKIEGIQDDIDPWDLADSRSLRNTLDLAGVDPLALLNGGSKPTALRNPVLAEAEARHSDFARIKILARDKGLVVGKDAAGYRKFLATNYGATSAAGFDPLMRKSLIEALERYQPAFDPSSMPEEFAEIEPQGVPV